VAACLAAIYVIWGTTYYALKVGIQGTPSFFLVGTRYFTAGALVLAWQAVRGRAWPTRTQWMSAVLIGFLLLDVGNGAIALAEHWVSSGATVALISVMPLATAVWSGLLGDWPRRSEWGAILLGAAGAAVMLTGQDLQANLGGTLLILLSTTSWALGTVLARRLDVPHGASGFGAEMFAAGTMALALSALLREPWALPRATSVWWAWAYLVVFGSLIAFSAYRFIVARVSATLASTCAYVNPPVALLVGWGLGHERFSLPLLIGLPIVLTAVAWHAFAHTRAAPRASTTPLEAGTARSGV
jgi:drug/metabolite transporter (DMT)-like permease